MKKVSKRTNRINLLFMLTAVFVLAFFLKSCKQKNKNEATEQETTISEAIEPVEEDIWVVEEYQINDIPLTTKAAPEKVEKTEGTKAEEAGETEKEEAAEEAPEHASETPSASDLDAALRQREYVPEPVKVTKAMVPLDETQSVVAYTKKGKAKAAMQVVSSADGFVDEIVFYDKKHKDSYNVEVGMSEKEVKKLRKDMKRMEKKGKVYLYNDNSNIMYLLKAEDQEGNAIGAAKPGNMQVSAIVWKPSKRELKKEAKEEENR